MLIDLVNSSEMHNIVPDAGLGEDFAMADTAADLFLVRGLAYCNLGDMELAMQSYEAGLEMSPDYHLLRLLSSEVYLERDDMESAHISVEAATGLSEEFDAFVMAASVEGNDSIGCRYFFDNLMALTE